MKHFLFVIVTVILLTFAVELGAQSVSNPKPKIKSQASAIEALFDLNKSTGPFPSDWFTAPDPTHNTGLRVNLPKPNCAERVSDCEDLDVINELDGFNVYPRLSVPFSGPIDLSTVTGGGVFLIRLGSTLPGGAPGGQVVGIDQVVFDPSSNMLYVQSDEVLDQHTRYLLVVTKDLLDESGKKVKATTAFLNFVDDSISESTGDPARDAYRALLRSALAQVDGTVVPRGQVVAASVFTTQSVTAVLEKIRDQIHAATPSAADFFLLGPNTERTVFSLNRLISINSSRQTQVTPPAFTPGPISLSPIQNDAVGSIAFGKYLSPNYEVYPFQYIPPVGTLSGTPVVQATNPIYFNLFLPSGTKPAGGWPVAIFVHGINGSKDAATVLITAGLMAKYGIATIAINDVGHGRGPLSTLTVSRTDGAPITFLAGGRGIDQNGDNKIGTNEGISAARPKLAVFYSDGYRQTAADLMQLVRVIEVGMDVDGDGESDVDHSRIYVFGQSLGGGISTVFASVEPDVRVGVLTVPFDPIPGGVLGCANRNAAGGLWVTRQPPILNSPGIQVMDGCTISAPWFDENFPLRDQIPLTVQLTDNSTRIIQSPVTNTIAGALAIQEVGQSLEWVGQAGSPLAYAPHLRKVPLDGVPAKSVLFLIAKGDQTAPNPTTTAIVRAGDLADRTLYYRHDLYCAVYPCSTKNAHGFAVDPGVFGEIALSVQDMIGKFFLSDGVTLPQPSQFLEFPIPLPLPESLNYLP